MRLIVTDVVVTITSASFSFVTIHACGRQTDRITTPKTALAYARAVKNGGLDQYGAKSLGRLIFATIRKSAGLKGLTATQYDY